MPYLRALLTTSFLALLSALPLNAVQVKISAEALERTLKTQLFSAADGRYYLRGRPGSACRVYAESPSVAFVQDRVVVHVHTNARLGTAVRGTCLGLSLAPNVDVSLLPAAEGETIGFRDARLDHVSDSRELNFLLMPFLSHVVPSSMQVNAATLLRAALARSLETAGYRISLDRLKIHSMQVQDNALVVDADGDLSVN